MTKEEKKTVEEFRLQTAKRNEEAIKAYNDAILKVVVAFSSKTTDGQFRAGLSHEQYQTLRALNVLRIDFGDSREP